MGEPQRARLVGGRLARRPAHRADPQGDGAHGQPPRAHRLQPLRGAHGRRRRGGRYGVRPRARAPGERARGGTHAGVAAQLHREHLRAVVGDGLSGAAGAPGRERRHRHLLSLRGRSWRLRRVGHSLGLRHLPAGLRARLARGDRERGSAQGVPLPQRRGRAPGERERPTYQPVGRRGDGGRVPPAPDRGAPHGTVTLRAAQHPRGRAGGDVAGAARAALLLAPLRVEWRHEDAGRHGLLQHAPG